MRRTAFAVLPVAVVGALVSPSEPAPRPLPLEANEAAAPLLAFVSTSRTGSMRLARVDRQRVRLVQKGSVAVGRPGAWSFSPDRSRLVVVGPTDGSPNYLRFVDLRRMRLLPGVVPVEGNALALRWLTPSRVFAVVSSENDGAAVLIIDVEERRIVGRTPTFGWVQALRRSGADLVMVAAPREGIGSARLTLVATSGAARSVVLERIAAGSSIPQTKSGPVLGSMVRPGLAVDVEEGHAYVLSADDVVADVDLASLSVAYHDLIRRSSLLEHLARWLEPRAEAKGETGPWREARWLGDGLIALTGSDSSGFVDAQGATHLAGHPSGLEIVDVRSWSVRTLDAGADTVEVTRRLLLVTGTTWASDRSNSYASGMGYAAYGPDWKQRFQFFAGKGGWIALVLDGRAYVGVAGTNRLHIIDLARGRVIGTRKKDLPSLLLGDAGPY